MCKKKKQIWTGRLPTQGQAGENDQQSKYHPGVNQRGKSLGSQKVSSSHTTPQTEMHFLVWQLGALILEEMRNWRGRVHRKDDLPRSFGK